MRQQRVQASGLSGAGAERRPFFDDAIQPLRPYLVAIRTLSSRQRDAECLAWLATEQQKR
jgi:hypothetical protein